MDDIIKVKHRGSFHVGGEKVKLENAPVEDFPYQGKFTFHSDPTAPTGPSRCTSSTPSWPSPCAPTPF